MKRKLLITSDLHLTSKQSEEYRHRTLRDATTKFITEHKPDALVILGDLTEEKDRHGSVLVNLIMNHLHYFAGMLPVFVMMGNHDYHNEGHPFFAFVQRLPNVVWIDKVTDGHHAANILNLGGMMDDIVFLPHTRNWKRDWANVKWKNFDFAFAHNTFMDAKSAQGHRLDGIPLEAIPDHVKVVAGDVHVPQSYQGITYIGAPYSVDFGDDYKARMMMLDGTKLRTMNTSQYPQKVMLNITDVTDSDEALELSRMIVKGDVVKARVKIDSMREWPEVHKITRDFIAAMGAIPYKIEPVVSKTNVKRRFDVSAGSTAASDRDVLAAYAKRHDVPKVEMAEAYDIFEHGADVAAGIK